MSKLKSTKYSSEVARVASPFSRRTFMKIAGVGAGAVAAGQISGIKTASAQEAVCSIIWPLTAGAGNLDCEDIGDSGTEVGTVTVSTDETNIYVDYTLTYQDSDCPEDPVDAEFGELHVWVGNDLLNLPVNSQGIPVPGQFCQAATGQCFDATGLTTYRFTFAIEDLEIAGWNYCNQPLYVVTHAEVVYLDCEGNEDGGDTAFGGDQCGGGNRWWFYGTFIPDCEGCGDGNPPTCQTSYAKGQYVWTTDKRSNPDKLPSLNLTRNRWGWAIKLTQTGITTHEIWEGAGLNDTSKGVLVGTLTLDWDGANVEVCYDITDGSSTISEVHIYAGDNAPTTIAPGQYGWIDSFDSPGVTEYCKTLPLADSNEDNMVWVVAHAVTCR